MFTDNESSSNVQCIHFAEGTVHTIMTLAEVADFLRVHRSTVSRLAKSGELLSHKIGNRLLFKSSDVWEFFDKQRVSRDLQDGNTGISSYSK